MTVKEFAKSMGVSVNELCKITDMSRQGLHDVIVDGYTAKESSKRMKAVDKLIGHINAECDKKQNAAETEHKDRVDLLKMFY